MRQRGEVHWFGHGKSRRRLVVLDVKSGNKFEFISSRGVVDDLVTICGAHNLLDLVVRMARLCMYEYM